MEGGTGSLRCPGQLGGHRVSGRMGSALLPRSTRKQWEQAATTRLGQGALSQLPLSQEQGFWQLQPSPRQSLSLIQWSTPPGWDMGPWGGDRDCSPLNNLSCLWLDPKRAWAGGSRPHTGQTVPAAAAMKAAHAVWTPRGSKSHSLPDPPCNHSCWQGDSHPPVQETGLRLPARVDEHRGLLHFAEEVLVAHSLGGRSQSTRHHNEVRLFGQPREWD